ncbi:MAG TPA: 50S ribosomal protein L2 [Leptospiraceae bacterium]|nr:50S ribosomal protein L2 [Leptospiraceae bacterium]HMZ60397.1 50S ribosomal protein L2 [Leptospiraceae bacterium]HNF13840.1 50S ribosomal protein L2 [Leptospiraceae bacterium]HNF23583.1 50S ribosomal protein L2 [Leptospiraceae bacterium]HNI96920.1 50S ribosomal protein L2 [Leptospiraceae bacterium]
MGIRKFKPTTSSLRYKSVLDFAEITAEEPYKPLTKVLNYKAARATSGRITVRQKGGRVKRKYRVIDFKRTKKDIPALVKTIEYDPNRSAFIALICYKDGEYSYILAPEGLKVGDTVISSDSAEIKPGNTLSLDKIPPGTNIHNVELHIGKGAQMARTAGGFAVVAAKDGDFVTLKLPSSEVRKVRKECIATVGIISNKDHNLVSLGKAGRSRWLGRRPKVRGVVMNPVDHPHGGGEGKTSGGRHPVSPWGQPTKGYKTRRKARPSDRFIVSGRKRNRNRGN